jgi:hypothetical protein
VQLQNHIPLSTKVEVYWILRSTRRSNFDESEVRRGTPGTGPWKMGGMTRGVFSPLLQITLYRKSSSFFEQIAARWAFLVKLKSFISHSY